MKAKKNKHKENVVILTNMIMAKKVVELFYPVNGHTFLFLPSDVRCRAVGRRMRDEKVKK